MFASKPRLGGGVEVVNRVDSGRFPLLLTRVAQGLQSSEPQVFSPAELEKLRASLELDDKNLSLLLDTLSFIMKQAAYHVCKPAVLREQLMSEGLNDEKASACAQVWASVAKQTLDTLRQRSLCSHELEDVKWSLGARISSSSQSSQRNPLAKLQLQISTNDNVTFEMNHSELSHLYSQLEQVQAQLDALK